MKDNDSIFGATPEGLDRLVFETLTLEERATLMGLLARLRDRAQELLNER